MHRSMNALLDRLSNKGVHKEVSELDDTWINILSGKLRTDYSELAAKDREGSLSMEGHIEEDIARPLKKYTGPRKNRVA